MDKLHTRELGLATADDVADADDQPFDVDRAAAMVGRAARAASPVLAGIAAATVAWVAVGQLGSPALSPLAAFAGTSSLLYVVLSLHVGRALAAVNLIVVVALFGLALKGLTAPGALATAYGVHAAWSVIIGFRMRTLCAPGAALGPIAATAAWVAWASAHVTVAARLVGG